MADLGSGIPRATAWAFRRMPAVGAMKNFWAAIAILSLTQAPCAGQEFKPHPKASITLAQWQAYFDEVKRKHGAAMQDIEAEKLLVFDDGATKTIYAFTKSGHPAHPAWITRKVEQRGDSIGINQIGYFAGDEPSFAQLFRSYAELNAKMEAEFKQRRKDAQSK